MVVYNKSCTSLQKIKPMIQYKPSVALQLSPAGAQLYAWWWIVHDGMNLCVK